MKQATHQTDTDVKVLVTAQCVSLCVDIISASSLVKMRGFANHHIFRITGPMAES